ncbi:MAG: lamin tail domain-containing protein [Luteolibacter sp.]|uniref:lamin tail domain-containing protein n=1 Tax=Luteolibacter sp. TaxID=1962973 RepID=UPI0032634B58
MFSRSRHFLLACFAVLTIRALHAAPLTVGDFSFEGNTLTAGNSTPNVGPEWLETGGPSSGNAYEEFITGFAADGTDHLGMNVAHDVWQDLGTTYQANTRYTLAVSVGFRDGFTQPGNQSQYLLADSTGTIYATGLFNASTLATQGFGNAPPLVFNTSDFPTAVGKTIRILLQSRGTGWSYFDNIRLDATALIPPGGATAVDLSASAVASTTATLNGRISDVGNAAPAVTFLWGTTDGGLVAQDWQNSLTLPGTQSGNFSTPISGLSPGGDYFFTVRSTNSAGTSWALANGTFSTIPLPPAITTVAASGITAVSATLAANVTSTGGESPVVTIFYGTTDGGTTPGAWTASISPGTLTGIGGAFVSGLTPGATYHFRAFAQNSGGSSWAPASLSFATPLPGVPTVENRNADGITGTTAVINGEVTDDGSSPPTVTIFYGTADGGTNPAGWTFSSNIGTDSGDFSHFVNTLTPQTTYYFRSRATNAAGSGWTTDAGSFTTTALVPQAAVINEFHYKPADKTSLEEFIELHNPGDTAIDLSGWSLASAVTYTFPSGTTLAAGGYRVIAENPAVLLAKFGVTALGPWTGKLSSAGEKIELRDVSGTIRDSVTYSAGFPWPTAAAGGGNSSELINAALDNDLGGSWRSSGSTASLPATVYVSPSATGWKYKKGTAEATSPVDAWRSAGFSDTSWTTAQTPIGYGTTVTCNTVLSDMRNSYSTVYARKSFTVAAGQIPDSMTLKMRFDDGCVVWINGTEVYRGGMAAGQVAYNGLATQTVGTAGWTTVNLTGTSAYLLGGTNVLAIHGANITIGGSSDFSIDAELSSAVTTPNPNPTPGAANSVKKSINLVPPQIRQVDHSPVQPLPGQAVTVTARITDPDGTGAVSVSYQTVDPGSYIRLTDAAYATSWTSVAMVDNGTNGDALAGDSVFTAILPGALQTNRRLVRYRITCADTLGNSLTVPYADDEQPNFAYYVYSGLPAWQGAFKPGTTAIQTFPPTLLDDLPVYSLIADGTDVINSQYVSGSDATRFYATFVYNGIVRDHITFKNRGEVSTYVSGKNKWRFFFNRARDLPAKNNLGIDYKETWGSFSGNACACPWAPLNRGMAGVEEATALKIYQLAGMASPNSHYYHFRVVRGATETPAAGTTINDPIGNADGQYAGDFWGLYMAIEQPGGSFLDERGLPDGNVYKIENNAGDKKNQGVTQSVDSSDWNTFRDTVINTSPTEAWWRANMDMDAFYTYHALNRLIGNVDLRAGNNHYFYHRSSDNRWIPVPWDLDMMFIAKTHQGSTINSVFYPGVIQHYKSLLEQPALALEYRNRAREILSLMASDATPNGGQFGQLVDEFAQIVNPTGQALTWADADAAMWNVHPRTTSSHSGKMFVTPFASSWIGGSWTRWLRTSAFNGTAEHEDSMVFLRDYSTNAWPGGTWTVNNGNQLGYGYQFLSSEAADVLIPVKPTLTYTGGAGFPIDQLQFTSSAFSDPQGSNTAAASPVQWRLAEISAPGIAGYLTGTARKYEMETLWTTTGTSTTANIPPTVAIAGKTYRARVRHQDNTGRWSSWSAPVQFTTSAPQIPAGLSNNLVVSELHYNDPVNSDNFDFVELKNIGTTPLDLTNVNLNTAVTFNFTAGTTLAPGAFTLVVKSLASFQSRHGTGKPVAGVYSGNLANGGEQFVLSYNTTPLRDFTYDDEAPWPTQPDGNGPSLTLINPNSNPDHALASNWTSSAANGGTPGADEPGPAGSMTAWVQTKFTPAEQVDPAISGPNADPDGDGRSNFLEFALATSPKENDLAALHFTWNGSGANRRPAIMFHRPIGITGVLYELLASDDLGVTDPWTAVANSAVETTVLNTTTEEVVFRDAETDANPKRFLRLRVAAVP